MGKLRSKAESALKESRARLGETSEAILRQTRETAARAMIMFAKIRGLG